MKWDPEMRRLFIMATEMNEKYIDVLEIVNNHQLEWWESLTNMLKGSNES